MAVLRKLMVLAAFVAAVLALAGCERKITRVEVVQGSPQSCFECHSDQNTILVSATQQWENSVHASGDHIERATAACAGCHTSEGFVARVAAGQVPPTDPAVTDVTNPTTIHCFTCHAPHTTGHFGLRWTARTVLKNGVTADLAGGNLCAACHQGRTAAPVSGRISMNNRFGPHHSNQADMIVGTNGYHYKGYTYQSIGHLAAVEDVCAGCHVERATRNNVVGGHTFNMRGELDGTEILNTAACAGCHGNLTNFNYNAVQDSVDFYIGQLQTILTTANLLSGGVPRSTTVGADSAGAVWNLVYVEEDRSRGVHNAKYALGLLKSSIQYMRGELPQTAPGSPLSAKH
jgi:hypothetical protein